jgi:hypothetical protein
MKCLWIPTQDSTVVDSGLVLNGYKNTTIWESRCLQHSGRFQYYVGKVWTHGVHFPSPYKGIDEEKKAQRSSGVQSDAGHTDKYFPYEHS